MDEPLVTFGLLMGMEVESKQDTGDGESGKEVLLVFCRTSESAEGEIVVTPRMLDLELMGMRPVAITRWNPLDTRYYAIFAIENLSDSLRNAVLNDTWNLLREALEDSEATKYSSTDNN
jgi:hypothetical protein